MLRKELTQEILKQHLRYDPLTGRFFWTDPRSTKVKVGTEAGYLVKSKNRWKLSLYKVKYYRSQLAFLYMKGRFPLEGLVIDHKDRDSTNDRWENLREITQLQNCNNKDTSPKSILGTPGITFQKERNSPKKWRVKANAYVKTSEEAIALHKKLMVVIKKFNV